MIFYLDTRARHITLIFGSPRDKVACHQETQHSPRWACVPNSKGQHHYRVTKTSSVPAHQDYKGTKPNLL
jgi:hypothetical protein